MGNFDNYDPVKALSAAVISQAALDYQELCDKGVSKIESYHGNYSKSEIVRFFRSDAAKILLKAIGGHYTGSQIISMLKDNEAANGRKKIYGAFTLEGEFVQSFNTLNECIEFTGQKSSSHILECCDGKNKRKTAGGYVWKYI